MTGQTPAQQQAALLAALAGHLRAHPDLAATWITPHSSVQLPRTGAATFVAWFASLGVTELRVNLQADYAEVSAHQAQIGGIPVEVWGGIEGLQRFLVQAGYGIAIDGAGLRLTLAELEHFAEHATLPEAGERR